MSSFARPCPKSKRVKLNNNCDKKEYFPGIEKIQYKPDASAEDTLCFKYYNENEMIHGKTMKEWLRFSVVFWHTFRGTGTDIFGFPTFTRSWDDGTNSMENAKRRLHAAFEFFTKLGNPYWAYHDRDIAPEGDNLEEANANLDEIADLAEELMKETGVELLWATCNLFSHPRYMNGAATNPNAHVVAYAAAQLKKGLEVANRLGAENYVFWGGREGFQTILNTDVYTELSHMANFFKMAVEYKKKIGFNGQFLIEPKPKEPTKHQYDYDAMSVIGFLKHFKLDEHFKLNIEPNHTTLAGHSYEHDCVMASAFEMLGSIDANTGSPELGWDTDQFPMDIKNCTLIMKTIIDQGGLQPGGLNFDCKLRRESTDVEDMFIAHIGAMDSFARGLKNAVHLITDKFFAKNIKHRYISFESEIGLKLANGTSTLEDCEEFILKNGEPQKTSGKQEHCEGVLNYYL